MVIPHKSFSFPIDKKRVYLVGLSKKAKTVSRVSFFPRSTFQKPDVIITTEELAQRGKVNSRAGLFESRLTLTQD